MAIETAKKHFSIVGSPAVNLLQDPEVDDTAYLVIEIQVNAGVKHNVLAHRKFASEVAELLGPKREYIKLHYDIM